MAQPIRWGILATGRIAGKMAHDLQTMPDAQIVAVGSRSQASADAFAAQYNIPRAYASYTAVAEDPNVDAIYVATPNDLHADNVRECLAAGKAVLCEKPFALNEAQTVPLLDLSRQTGVFLMEAMWSRFIPAQRKLYDMAQAGLFGDIRMVQADFGFRSEPDPDSRLFNPERGGGALLDVGVYALAVVVRFLGAPERIVGYAHIGETGVDEQSGILLGFPGGAVATLTCAIRTQTFNDARIFGTNGRARLHEPFWKATELTTHIANQEQRYALPREDWGYQYQIEEVHRCLRAGEYQSPGMPHHDTLTIVRIMDELRRQWGLQYPGE